MISTCGYLDMKDYKSVGQLSYPPLVYTAGFVFINLKNIEEYVGKIQDILKDMYPGTSELEMKVSEVNPIGEKTQKTIKYFAMNDPELRWGVVVTDHRFILHTIDYKHFNDFGAKFKEAFTKFLKVTGLQYHSGLAYRQIDNFSLLEGENSLSECVDEKFLSLNLPSAIEESKPNFLRQEHRYSLQGNSSIVLRTFTFENNKGPSIPEDLIPLSISLNHKILEQNIKEPPFMLADFEVNRILDGKSEKISVEDIVDELDKFHKYSSLIFRQVIKKDALDRRR